MLQPASGEDAGQTGELGAAANAHGRSGQTGGLGVLGFEFCNVCEQLVFAGQAAETEADHLIRSQRRFAARPEADQHAGDDRAVGLNLDAVFVVAQEVTATQDMFEKSEKNFNSPPMTK